MSANDLEQSGPTPERHEGPSPPPGPPEVVATAASNNGPWRWALAAGLLAALTAWACGEAVRRAFPEALEPKIVAFPTAADAARVLADQTKSAALNFALQAAILGALLGLAGGLSRRSVGRGLLAMVIGAVLGAAGAAGASAVLPFYYKNVNPETESLGLSMLTHGAFWAVAGAMAGAAFGVGRGGRTLWLRCALGGLLGGIGATIFYDVTGALLFPLAKTSQPVAATTITRVVAQFAVGLLVAAGAAMGAQEDGGKPRPADPMGE